MATRVKIDAYNGSLEKLTSSATDIATANLAAMIEDGEYINHRSLMDWLDPLLESVTDDAAVISSEFYNAMREISIGDTAELIVDSGRIPEASSKSVYAFLTESNGNNEMLSNLLRQRVSYEIRRAAGTSMFNYGLKDRERPRFARVPGYSKSYGAGCPFCIMLASRGFVYLTAKSAGAYDHYHPDCRCTVVPGWDTVENGFSRRASLATQIDGYDPDALYDQYVDDLKNGRLKINDISRYTSHVANWSSEMFKSYGDFVKFAEKAKSIDELQYRCAVLEQEWKKTGLSDRYYMMLAQKIQEIKRKLIVG